jgi:tetratricopeptide (TPR) repeat protein
MLLAHSLLGLIVFGLIPANAVHGSFDGAQEFQKLIQEARSAEQAKDYARAAQVYREIVNLRPNDPVANQNLGLAYYLQNNHSEAIASLRKALDLDPKLFGASLYLGISYYRTNQFALAVDTLKKARSLNPKETISRYWLGASYLASGILPAAVTELEAASKGAPKDAEVLYLLARSYSKYSASLMDRLLQVATGSASAHRLRAEDFVAQGLPMAALQELEKGLAEDPRMPGLHLAKGDILFQEKKLEEAAAEVCRELANDPPSPEGHYRLGVLYLTQNKTVDALPHLDFAAKQKPHDTALQRLLRETLEKSSNATREEPRSSCGPFRLSNSFKFPEFSKALDHYSRGDFLLAVRTLERFLLQHPGFLEGRRLLARCFLAQGLIEKTVAELERILKQLPDDPESLYGLGKAYETLFSQVIEQIFELNPGSHRVRSLRGEAYETGYRHEYERALQEYRQALELAPDLPGYQFAVGRILWKMQRFDEAIPYLRKELELNSHHGLANYHLGNIYLSQGENDRAIQFLEAAIRAQPTLTEAYLDLGRALAGTGKYELAIQKFQKVIETWPDDPAVYSLLANAYRSLGKNVEAERALQTFRELSAKKRQSP